MADEVAVSPDLVNKNVLIEDWPRKETVIEVTILSISPSKRYIKVKSMEDTVYWIALRHYNIVDVLD